MDPWTYTLNLARLGIEAQQVIALRMMRLAAGGALARREAERMIAEKSAALMGAQMAAAAALIGGRGTQAAARALRPYKRAVSRNRQRLTRRRRSAGK
jgi:geranylgeranyl pyrophosphate synthase